MKKKVRDCTVVELVSVCKSHPCDKCPLNMTAICSKLSVLENNCSSTDIIGEIVEQCDKTSCDDCDVCKIPDNVCGCIEYIRENLNFEVEVKDTKLFDELNKKELNDDEKCSYPAEPTAEWYDWRISELEKDNCRLRKLVKILLDLVPEE